jgi:hypothetical protein
MTSNDDGAVSAVNLAMETVVVAKGEQRQLYLESPVAGLVATVGANGTLEEHTFYWKVATGNIFESTTTAGFGYSHPS